MKRCTFFRGCLLVALTILAFGNWNRAAEAFPIKYVFDGVGAFGDVNGVAFDDAAFKIQILGDTANVDTVTDPTTPIISNLKGTMVIKGPGMQTVGNFTNLLNVFVQHTSATQPGNQVGFGEATLGDLIGMFEPYVGLNTFNLKTLFGPIMASDLSVTSGRNFSQFGGVPLSIGLVTLDMADEIFFTANVNHKEFIDLDNDYKTDLTIWRPASGTWFTKLSSTGAVVQNQWGAATDVPVPEDYDGDGITDIAVWRPADGTWYIKLSSTGAVVQTQWGAPTDLPVTEDYDGDGKADLAVFRPSTGQWFIQNSTTGQLAVIQWGSANDVPVERDYDGDGISDIAVWRPATGEWFILRSSDGIFEIQTWGAAGDTPVTADYDGDGVADLAVFRPGAQATWFIKSSLTGLVIQTAWGTTGDIPVPGDYDGDNINDLAVFRPSDGNWYILNSSTGLSTVTQWGALNDIPLSH